MPFSSRWGAAVAGDAEALANATAMGESAVYGWLRASGASAEEAAERTENFLGRLHAAEPPAGDEKEISRLSDFLLRRLVRYAEDGFPAFVTAAASPIHRARAERRFKHEPSRSPAEVFSRRWSMTILERTLDTLRREAEANSEGAHFSHLVPFLGFNGGGEEKYVELAAQLDLSVSVLRLSVYNFRRRYREVLRLVIGDTVLTEADVDSELTLLLCAAG